MNDPLVLVYEESRLQREAANWLTARMGAAFEADIHDVVLSLSDDCYPSKKFLAAMVAVKAAQKPEGRIRIVTTSSKFGKVLDLCGMTPVFGAPYETVEDAIASLEGEDKPSERSERPVEAPASPRSPQKQPSGASWWP